MEPTIDEGMAALLKYLRTLRLTAEFPKDEDGYHVDQYGNYESEASPAASLAREWARELLEAADADGAGACRLCRS